MIFASITRVLGPRIGMAGLTVKNHAPEIYLAGAIGAGVASAVMLAKAHKKSDEVFEDIRKDIETVREYLESGHMVREEGTQIEDTVAVSKEDTRRMLVPLYVETIKRGTILYGPAVLMGVSSIALLLASRSVMRGRNRALLSALTLFERGFATYRKRVIDELGEEADERFYFGADSRKITTLTKNKDGKSVKKKISKNHIPEEPTPMIYSRVFDETNTMHSPDPDMSEFFLRAVQQHMNDQLDINGYLMLNTVYKALTFKESPEGAVVGWSRNVPGDDFVSFGMENDINQRSGDNRWILDFNVNGVVFERIGEK